MNCGKSILPTTAPSFFELANSEKAKKGQPMSNKIASSSEYIAEYLVDEECTEIFEYLQSAPYNVYIYAKLEKWLGAKSLKRAPKVE